MCLDVLCGNDDKLSNVCYGFISFLLQMREITCFYDTSTKWASKPALLHHLTARVLAWCIPSKNIRRISN